MAQLTIDNKPITNPNVELLLKRMVGPHVTNITAKKAYNILDANKDTFLTKEDLSPAIEQKSGSIDKSMIPFFSASVSYVSKLLNPPPKVAVVRGISHPGTPGNPHFTIEFADKIRRNIPKSEQLDMFKKGKASHGFHVPAGSNKGDVLVIGAKRWIVSIVDIGKGKVQLELRNRDSRSPWYHKAERSVTINKQEITKRGFALRHVHDSDGMKLKTQLRDYLWSFVTQSGQFEIKKF